MIPKIIHQIWMQTKKKIPEKFNNNIESIKKYHQNYKYILWDEIKILKLIFQNKKWTEIYYKFSYLHQKIDFAKYIILYLYGGIYIDIDVEVVKSFDLLLDKYNNEDLIISKLNLSTSESYITNFYFESYNNGVIIAKKNSIVMDNLINYIINNYDKITNFNKVFYINLTTGPSIFTFVININKNKTIILNSEYLEPCNRNNCNITENTITVHRHELSWIPEIFKICIDFYLQNKYLFIIIIIFIIYLNFGSI